MNETVTMVKCACSDCVCVVDAATKPARDGRIYCSPTCADHHKDGKGCDHAGCACHG
jgi:metallothionein